MMYWGRAYNTDFIKTSLPPIDNFLACQLFILPQAFSANIKNVLTMLFWEQGEAAISTNIECWPHT